MAKVSLITGRRSSPEENKRIKDKEILTWLSVIAATFGFILCIFSGYVAWVTYHLQEASILLSVIGILLTALGVIGVCAGRTENYSLLYAYVYGVIFMTPIILLAAVTCFSFHDTLSGFVKHSWDRASTIELRNMFCESHTAESECRAPVRGGRDYNTTEEWCMAGCPLHGKANSTQLCAVNSSGCEEIVSDAQHDAHDWLQDCFKLLGANCVVIATLLVMGIGFAIRLITVPIIMKRLLTVVNCESFLPVGLSIAAGVYSLNHDFFVAGLDWIAWVFIAIGISCAFLAVLGTYAGAHKHRTGLGIYLVSLVVVLSGCVLVCTACWVLTGELDDEFKDMSEEDLQKIPCDANFDGCCCCGNDDIDEVCPEWSRDAIKEFVRMNLKVLGFISFFMFFFMSIGFAGALAWFQSLANYQCESV